MNIFDWLILLIIAAAVFFALRSLWGRKNRGCCDSCAGCPYHCARERKQE